MMEKLQEIYKKMSGRERVLLYGAIAGAIIMLTDLTVLNPILSHIRVLESEIQAKSEAVQRDLRILAFKENILREYSRYEDFLDTGERAHEELISQLLRRLESLATQNDITITNVMPGEIEKKPIYDIYSTSLEFEGPLRNILTFMYELEGAVNLFRVKRYTLEPRGRAGQVMRCEMDVERILVAAEDVSELYDAMEMGGVVEPSRPLGSEFAGALNEMEGGGVALSMGDAVPEPL